MVEDYDELQVKAAAFVLDGGLSLSTGGAVLGYNHASEGMLIVWDIDGLPHMTEAELMAFPAAYVRHGRHLLRPVDGSGRRRSACVRTRPSCGVGCGG